MSDVEPQAPLERTVAEMRQGRWPGWIWGVPIAAVAIVLWLTVREISLSGVTATVTYEGAAGIKEGSTDVRYRGVKVGKVSKLSLSPDGSHVVVKLDIERGASHFLRTGTRFYLQGAHPSLTNPDSLKALITGPTIQMIPGGGAPARTFQGIVGAAPASLGIAVEYRVQIAGEVGGLEVGSPVVLSGFKVGEVSSVDLSVDAQAGTISTSALIALDPRRFHLMGGPASSSDWPRILNEALAALIRHDLRARLTKSPPILGSPEIELARVEGSPAATLQQVDGYYQIPSVEQGGVGRVIEEAQNLPLEQIGDNVRAITASIRSLAASPQLKASIGHLDAALASLDRTLNQAGPKVAPTLDSVRKTVQALRHTAQNLDQAAQAARQVMGTSPAAPDGSLEPALLHLSEAARSIRVLADYLDEHPESLLRGRR
ncbi:MAG TPA: MlaD family protein [Steroidobacteraceae bacterium]|nr:MlaD family protein [Steroidobacteraceae bacterium]